MHVPLVTEAHVQRNSSSVAGHSGAARRWIVVAWNAMRRILAAPDERVSRSRALVAALDWGGLTRAALRTHVLAPEPERPQFLVLALADLAKTPYALTDDEADGVWSRVLHQAHGADVLVAVRHLLSAPDARSKPRILAALDRIANDPPLDGREYVRLRQEAEKLPTPGDTAR